MNIVSEIKTSFKSGSTLIKLLYVNIGVFIIVNVVHLVLFLLNIPPEQYSIVNWLSVPANLNLLMTRPWTMITYMFLHEEIWHIIFNMLWLYWFGHIFLQYLDDKKLFQVYILGGIAGAFFYILCYNIFPAFQQLLPSSIALGASASVLAVVIAISAYVPDYSINLLFIGPVKIKYIAIFTIILDIVSIKAGNSGGHLAHLGGAIFGYVYIMNLKKGKDLGLGIHKISDFIFNLFTPRKKIKISYQRPKSDFEFAKEKNNRQKETDRILDKIAKGGYESLSKEEKEFLFNQSKK